MEYSDRNRPWIGWKVWPCGCRQRTAVWYNPGALPDRETVLFECNNNANGCVRLVESGRHVPLNEATTL